MSLTNEEIREFSLMALDQPSIAFKHKNIFAFTIYASSNSYTVRFGCQHGGKIYWGDGAESQPNTSFSTTSHTYRSGIGYYQIIIEDLQDINFGNDDLYSTYAIVSIDTIFPETFIGTSLRKAFFNCRNITSIPRGLFDHCTEVTSFQECFSYSSCFNFEYKL